MSLELDVPLAAVERHAATLPEGLVERSLLEVLAHGSRDGEFAAGVLAADAALPVATRRLLGLLRRELVDSIGRRYGMQLEPAYVKAGDGDAPPNCRFAPCAACGGGRGLFRVLLNLSEYPRRVLVDDEELLIPGRRCGALHALHFWPSGVAHCGVNDELGYFLAAFETRA